MYRGSLGYHQYIKKTEAQLAANKFTGTQGPIRATTHIAISNRFDYQPGICLSQTFPKSFLNLS